VRVQTFPNFDISLNSNGHISELRDATVTWLGKLVIWWYGNSEFKCMPVGFYNCP